MDIQNAAKQLVNYLGQNPALITQFIEHPYSTTAKATGTDAEISKKDMSQIVTAAAALSNNQKLDMGQVAAISSALLGQNNDSVHSLTSMLFGGGTTQQATQAAQQQTTQAGTLELGSLVNLAGLAATLMGGATAPAAAAQQPKPSVNLSDGLDLGEIATLAGQFLSASNASQQAAAPTQQQPVVLQQQAAAQQAQAAKPNIDFGTIAQLASMFLKQQ